MNEGAGDFVYHVIHMDCLKFTVEEVCTCTGLKQGKMIWTVLTESPQSIPHLVIVSFLMHHVKEKSEFQNWGKGLREPR